MSLVNELIKGLLPEEEKKKVVAVYGGGFKPPTSGHFQVVKQALKENPEIDEFIILIGGKERDGISPDESLLIWDIYKTYLPFKVNIQVSSKPPIRAVYNYAKEHPNEEVLFVIGAREGNEEDFKDITSRTTSLDNYPNLNLRTIVTQGGVSGTAARNAAKVSLDKFAKFVPDQLSDEETKEVFNLVSGKIQENKSSLEYLNSITKEAPFNPPQYLYHLSAPENIDSILKTGLKPGKPEASLHGGIMKGEEFSGVWLTPIDDVYEIVETHHLPEKFYNGEILQIDTSGLNKDRFSIGIEYNLMKPPFTKQEYLDRTEEIIYLDAIPPSAISILQENVVPNHKGKAAPYGSGYKKLNEAIDSSKFNFSPYIASLTKHMLDNGMKLEPLPKVQMIHDDYENGEDLFGNTAYYNPGNNSVILFTYGRHPKDILRSYAHELVHVHQNMEDRLTGLGANTDVNQDDHLEQIEREAYETGNIMFRSWTDSITGNKLNESVKTLITEKKKKDPFGLKAYAMELARGLEEQESEYKVYLDMDGVLADFDKRFKDISGMEPKEFENKYGTKAFWNLIDEENKISFWVGIPEMPGAKALVDAVKDYNFELLTSPSAKKQSYLGKILWVRNHNSLFGGKPRINFKKAKEKHEVKPELSKTDILIDDREDTIGRWNAAGGTGIHYKNIGQVLNDLKKLGL